VYTDTVGIVTQTKGPISKPADASATLHPLINERWSPRALDPDTEISWNELRGLAEAARWAPSYGNTQPARFIFGRRGDDTFAKIFDALTQGNKNWAANAAALILGVAVHENEKGEIPYAEYGLGLATQNLVLQAVSDGFVAHQMAGFSADRARELFDLPTSVTPLVTTAIGGPGQLDVLPEDKRDRELAERRRHPLAELVFTGDWGEPAFGDD
jgi:nitroreductase